MERLQQKLGQLESERAAVLPTDNLSLLCTYFEKIQSKSIFFQAITPSTPIAGQSMRQSAGWPIGRSTPKFPKSPKQDLPKFQNSENYFKKLKN